MDLITKILLESQIKLFEKKSPYTYGCVLLELDFPELKTIHKEIKKEDLYEESGSDHYGLEKESHVTLLYGLHKEVTKDEIEDILNEFKLPSELKLAKVSSFNNTEYDVLKFDVDCKVLHKINKKLSELPNTNKYPDYHPHLTLCYLQSGKAKEYVKLFKDKSYTLKISKCLYSQPSGKKSTIKINLDK